MLVVLYVVFQHFQSVESGCLGMTDGSPPFLLAFGNHLGTACRILSLYMLHLRMLSQELTTLHQGHRVRMNLSYRIPVVIWQTADAVRDVQLVLTHNGSTGVAQQLVVM